MKPVVPANHQNHNRYTYALNNPLKYVDPTGYSDISSIIRQLWDAPYGGYWNSGDESPTTFNSQAEALAYVSDNFTQLTTGGTGKTQRQIVVIYNIKENGTPYYYDLKNGEVWNSVKSDFQPAGSLLAGKYWDADGNFFEYFLPDVEIKGISGRGMSGRASNVNTVVGVLGLTNGVKINLVEWGMEGADWGVAGARYLRFVKGVGYGFTLVNSGVGIYKFVSSDKSWGDYGQLGISILTTGLILDPYTSLVGMGLGAVDMFGGFNGFYNFLDTQQNFYNKTGMIFIPGNFPVFIRLK